MNKELTKQVERAQTILDETHPEMGGTGKAIERLRADLKVQQDAANHWFAEANKDHSRCVKLEAENATLRQALRNHAEEEAKMVNAEPASRSVIQDALIYGKPPLYMSPRMLTEQAPCNVPEGWVMVPKEPTEAMLDHIAGTAWRNLAPSKQAAEFSAYRAMIAAAPKKENEV